MLIDLSLNGSWWSLEEALVWIASSDRPSLLRSLELDHGPSYSFDADSFFRGFSDVTSALRYGELPAHASIDTAPVSLVNPPFWNSVDFIPYWNVPATNYGFNCWPKILILSQRPFRSEALLDHSERSHLLIPTAKDLKGEPGYYRVISDVMLSRVDVVKIWQRSSPQTSGPNDPPKTRKKRETAIKVEKSLAMMSHNHLSLAGSTQGLSYNEIAGRLVNRWYDEGDETTREIGSVAKAVLRYYERQSGTGNN